jgi:tRNA acetyltransferase TAN1
LAAEIWEEDTETAESQSDPPDGEISLEAQIAKELAVIKQPRKEQRFSRPVLLDLLICTFPQYFRYSKYPDKHALWFVHTLMLLYSCIHLKVVIFIACKPPVDPVKLVTTHIKNVERTGVLQTRYDLINVRRRH